MIILVNKCTRLSAFLMSKNKEYIATLKLGIVTDSRDMDGSILERNRVAKIKLWDIKKTLSKYSGTYLQSPPIFSAIKHKGIPAYRIARKGGNVILAKRPVNIYEIEILKFNRDKLKIRVVCGSGTYIRSLAHDIGSELGCGAALEKLQRTRIGVFDLKNSLDLRNIEKEMAKTDFLNRNYFISMEKIIDENHTFFIKKTYVKNILNGQSLSRIMLHSVKKEIFNSDNFNPGDCILIKDSESRLLAIHEIINPGFLEDSGFQEQKNTKSIVFF